MNAGAMPSVHRALRRVTRGVIAIAWGGRALFACMVLFEGGGDAQGWAMIALIGVHVLLTAVAAPVQLLLALVLPWTAGATARAEARVAGWLDDRDVPVPGRVAYDGIALWALIDAVLTVLSITPWLSEFFVPPS